MADRASISVPESRFPYWRWEPKVEELAKEYRENQPFPHIRLTNFLEPELAQAIAAEFPSNGTKSWTQYKHQNENKLGMTKRKFFPPELGAVADDLTSPRFAAWLSRLTGIAGLISDPSFEGGGLHQSTRGGFLNVHTDFSMHHYQKNWRRRVNVLIYLNPLWREEWGGAIEFWEQSMRRCGAKYPPLLNHSVIFTTDERSLHGFPDPLTCPEGTARKSLAFYYYTVEQLPTTGLHSTDYRARPSDGWGTRSLIWMDKKAVDLYSRAKMRLGFSDELASKVLRFLSHK
jgi:hypothetical protein